MHRHFHDEETEEGLPRRHHRRPPFPLFGAIRNLLAVIGLITVCVMAARYLLIPLLVMLEGRV